MIKISPIRALRPEPNIASELVSLPYDVMSRAEARQMAEGKPASFLRIIRSDLEFDDSVDPYAAEVYDRALANLQAFRKKGWLIREEKPSLYVYRLSYGPIRQTGLVAGSWIEDYAEGRIKKHEFTRPEKEKDRTTHIDCLGANTGPVFLLYKTRALPEIQTTLNELANTETPLYDLAFEDGVRHSLYLVPDEAAEQLIVFFNKLDAVYIADGHHRAASAYKNGRKRAEEKGPEHEAEPHNFFLTVTFPDEELSILPYNRVVKDLHGLSQEEFLEKIQKNFSIQKGKRKIQGPYDLNLYLGGQWYFLQALPHSYEGKNERDRLAVSVLQDTALAPLLGIDDPRTSDRIQFIGGIRGDEELMRLVDSKEFAVAFSMPPVSTEDIIRIADAGKTMPPKSTWFEPKLRSGFVTHLLDE